MARLALDTDAFHAHALDHARALPPADPHGGWLRRALSYPYRSLAFSFVWAGGEVLPLLSLRADAHGSSRVLHAGRERSVDEALIEGGVQVDWAEPRFPLLCYGSNASLEGLERKLRGLEGADAVVPLERGELHGLDVVYSPHISAYGSVPATIQRSPGTRVAAAVAWVTGAALARFVATELNYRFGRLPEGSFASPPGAAADGPYAFVSRHGCLTRDGAELALRPVPAAGRRFTALSQREVLDLVAGRLAVGRAAPRPSSSARARTTRGRSASAAC